MFLLKHVTSTLILREGRKKRGEREREFITNSCLLYFFSLIVFSLSLFANVAAVETIVIEIVFIPFILLTTFAQ